MAYATHSTESQIDRFLHEENTTVTFLAALAELHGIRGSSQSRLSAMQRGKALEHDASIQLGALIGNLKALRELARPIPVRFRDAQEIARLLRAMEAGGITVVVYESEPDEVQQK